MKQKDVKREWFIVLSNYGYFSGLNNGGKPQWTQHFNEAKPLDNEAKFRTLQMISGCSELILDYIK